MLIYVLRNVIQRVTYLLLFDVDGHAVGPSEAGVDDKTITAIMLLHL